jgi:hypothetical protein
LAKVIQYLRVKSPSLLEISCSKTGRWTVVTAVDSSEYECMSSQSQPSIYQEGIFPRKVLPKGAGPCPAPVSEFALHVYLTTVSYYGYRSTDSHTMPGSGMVGMYSR